MCEVEGTNVVPLGIDLSEFYMSVEWDILEVPAVRNEKFYTCCDEPYLDITFNITMRRKTLFYTVNLIIPCMGISFLTVLTFYLPSDSGEKVTLSISILTSLYVFFLLVVEIIPPTSLVVPLLGKYLIFAMILVSISICVTVVVLNVHFRSPQTHKMAPWVKRVFIHILPRLLIMKRPQFQPDKHHSSLRKVMLRTCVDGEAKQQDHNIRNNGFHKVDEAELREAIAAAMNNGRSIPPAILDELNEDLLLEREAEAMMRYSPLGDDVCKVHGTPRPTARFSAADDVDLDVLLEGNHHMPPPPSFGRHRRPETPPDSPRPPLSSSALPPYDHSNCSFQLHKSCACVSFIAEHTKAREEATKVKEDWKYVAMVLDRLFLWIFTLAVCVGTAGIILQAPSLYDDRIPIDREISGITHLRTRKKVTKSRTVNSC